MIDAAFLARVKASANGDPSYHNRDDNDMPVVVDPVERDAWIHEGSDRHARSQARGNYFDNRALVQSIRSSESHLPKLSYTLPSTAQLDAAKKYSNQFFFDKCNGRVLDKTRDGLLPAVSKQIYEGSLLDKSTGDIEHEIREAERYTGNRLFDKSGYSR